MTREKAKRYVAELGSYAKIQNWNDEYFEATNMAIKAIEQEPILDKIRAEISDFEEEVFNRPNTDYSDYAAVRHCLEIIDKYKAESEE